MWKLTAKAKGMLPLPGVPWQDYTDEEWRVVAREWAERNQAKPADLQASGFWEHVEDKKSASIKEE